MKNICGMLSDKKAWGENLVFNWSAKGQMEITNAIIYYYPSILGLWPNVIDIYYLGYIGKASV